MALDTNRPFLHIIIIHIIIIHIIHVHIIHVFLFRSATANLCACFPLKPIGICFLHHWPGLSYFKFRFLACLQITGSDFIISANIDDHKAIQVCIKNSPLRRDYRAINYPEILPISVDIPI